MTELHWKREGGWEGGGGGGGGFCYMPIVDDFVYTFIFYKNILYKSIEAQIGQILRIF